MPAKTFNNKKVVITRPFQRAQVLADQIRENKGIPIIVPTLELELTQSEELKYIAQNIKEYDWIIFTSPAGVKSFFNTYKKQEIPIKTAAIGIKTEEELHKHNNKADIIPEKFTAEGLLEEFTKTDLKNKKIALPRTLSARKILPETLEKHGAKVTVAEAYTSKIPENTKEIQKLTEDLINKKIDIITFTSPLTVTNLLEVAKNHGKYEKLLEALKNNVTVATIGPITGKVLKDLNIKIIEPEKYTVKNMINTILEQT